MHWRENSKKFHTDAFFYENGVILDILKFLADFKLILIKRTVSSVVSVHIYNDISKGGYNVLSLERKI